MEHDPDISIIIPSYNSYDTLGLCLESIGKQSSSINIEIIVVDCSNNQVQIDAILHKYTRVKLIKRPGRFNPGIGRNMGAEIASSELLAFIDSDIIVEDNWANKVVDYYKKGHVIFNGSINMHERSVAWPFYKLEHFYEFNEFSPSMKEGSRWFIPSCSLVIMKQIFVDTIFLDMETSEDIELMTRLKQKGFSIYFNPNIHAFHCFRSSLIKLIIKVFKFGIGNAEVRKIHPLPGSNMMKNKFIAVLFVPLFAAIKLSKITWRNIKYNNVPDKFLYILLSPLMLLLIFSWMAGFYCGILKNKK